MGKSGFVVLVPLFTHLGWGLERSMLTATQAVGTPPYNPTGAKQGVSTGAPQVCQSHDFSKGLARPLTHGQGGSKPRLFENSQRICFQEIGSPEVADTGPLHSTCLHLGLASPLPVGTMPQQGALGLGAAECHFPFF